MPSPAAVLTGINTAVKLASSIGKMSNLIPDTPKDLEDKHRWVTVTVFNQTQYALVYKNSYFDSGKFWTAPTNVEPFEEMSFSGCDKDGSFLTGVSGGTTFTLQMPIEGGGYKEQDIGIGFTNPELGSTKASGIFSSSAEDAYDNTTDDTTEKTSSKFSGKDTNDKDTAINFLVVSGPGQEGRITITQQIISGGN
ncbi:hypothetical protein L4D09_00140 [Photobacterium makurazakiensis]|uniref:hypothetical protein n=1 Tax=Photobacterium makurazakiensis TaxID=2910234 RepID=UPI003D0C42C6